MKMKLTAMFTVGCMMVYGLILIFSSPITAFILCTIIGAGILYFMGLGCEYPKTSVGGLPAILGIAIGASLCFWRMPHAFIFLPIQLLVLLAAFGTGAFRAFMKIVRSL